MKFITSSVIRVGLVGVGKSAVNFHIPLLQCVPEFQVTAVVSSKTDEHVSKLVGRRVRTFNDIDDFAQSGVVDLAIILTPNHLHFLQAELLLNAGIHVVVDKPFTTNSLQSLALCQLAKSKQLLLSVFHNRRWDSDFLTVKKLIDEQVLGKVRHLESCFDKYRPVVINRWREQALAGSGLLFDIGSHLVDQALELFGLPAKVFASIRLDRDNARVADAYQVVFYYTDKEVVLKTTSIAATTPYRFYVQGTEGCYVKMHGDLQETFLSNKHFQPDMEWITEQPEHYGNLYVKDTVKCIVSEQGDYRKYYQNIAAAMMNFRPLKVSAIQAACVVKLLEIAIESSLKASAIEVDLNDPVLKLYEGK